MSSSRSQQTSGSEENSAMDQRKRKRMISNRESARRSRMRKQQHLDELLGQVARLKTENTRISMQIDLLSQQLLGLDGDNTVLRTQLAELTDRLRSLNSVLRFVREFSGMAMDIPEIPEPWQLPCPVIPIVASASMLRF